MIREYGPWRAEEILPLYESVAWTNYTQHPDMLERAFQNSLLILGAYEDGALVGLLRAVGDGASVVLVQDLLVLPAWQRRGIGTALVHELRARYPGVYQLQLLTDDTERSCCFYQSLGFRKGSEMGCEAFLQIGSDYQS